MRSNGHQEDVFDDVTEWQLGEDPWPSDIDVFLDRNVRPQVVA